MTTSETGKSDQIVPVEIHFTDGFFEDVVHISAGQTDVMTEPLKTRMQTGLAHIEILQLETGREVTLESEKRHLKTTITVDATKPFITVAARDGVFEVTAFERTPGYL